MATLKDYRTKRGKTLEDMAALLDVSVTSLSRIERGEQWPSRDFFVKLEEVTRGRVTVRDFMPKREKGEEHGEA